MLSTKHKASLIRQTRHRRLEHTLGTYDLEPSHVDVLALSGDRKQDLSCFLRVTSGSQQSGTRVKLSDVFFKLGRYVLPTEKLRGDLVYRERDTNSTVEPQKRMKHSASKPNSEGEQPEAV